MKNRQWRLTAALAWFTNAANPTALENLGTMTTLYFPPQE
jgi:hypothetical protein